MVKWALVTGGDQGLGETLGVRLRDLGFKVRSIDGSNIRFATTESVCREVSAICREEGSVPDLTVLNYGIHHLSWVGGTPATDDDIFRVNTVIPYYIVDQLIRLSMLEQHKERQIVFVSSAAARVQMRCSTLYAASKAAVNAMVKNLARELANTGWQVLGIAPGKIEDTRMSELVDQQVCELRGWTPESSKAYAVSMIPEGRYTSRHEVADAFVGLIQMPRYVNGHILEVMGGV